MKKRVHVPGLGRHVIIGGCKLPKHEPHGFKLKDFLVAFPSSPAVCDWTPAARTVIDDIEGNDLYGDCVLAEDAHYIAVETGNANTLFAYSREQTLADYAAITGFKQDDPSTDIGTDPIVDLNYRVAKGYADGSKDAGWALVDASNKAEVQFAIANFGQVKMWFGIPSGIEQSMPHGNGFVWDVAAGPANPDNGHAIGGPGYGVSKIADSKPIAVTVDGVLVSTWGMLGIVTWRALAAWFIPSVGGGMAVRVTHDWINRKTNAAPSGLNLSAIVTAFNVYFGGNLPVPPPPVTPGPGPSPRPSSVSLVQAEDWAAKGINAHGHLLMTKAQAIAAANSGLATAWPTTP